MRTITMLVTPAEGNWTDPIYAYFLRIYGLDSSYMISCHLVLQTAIRVFTFSIYKIPPSIEMRQIFAWGSGGIDMPSYSAGLICNRVLDSHQGRSW